MGVGVGVVAAFAVVMLIILALYYTRHLPREAQDFLRPLLSSHTGSGGGSATGGGSDAGGGSYAGGGSHAGGGSNAGDFNFSFKINSIAPADADTVSVYAAKIFINNDATPNTAELASLLPGETVVASWVNNNRQVVYSKAAGNLDLYITRMVSIYTNNQSTNTVDFFTAPAPWSTMAQIANDTVFYVDENNTRTFDFDLYDAPAGTNLAAAQRRRMRARPASRNLLSGAVLSKAAPRLQKALATQKSAFKAATKSTGKLASVRTAISAAIGAARNSAPARALRQLTARTGANGASGASGAKSANGATGANAGLARAPRADGPRLVRAPAPLVAAPKKQAMAHVSTPRGARTGLYAAQPRPAAGVPPRSRTTAVTDRSDVQPKLGVPQPRTIKSVASRSRMAAKPTLRGAQPRAVAIRTAAKPTPRGAQPRAVASVEPRARTAAARAVAQLTPAMFKAALHAAARARTPTTLRTKQTKP